MREQNHATYIINNKAHHSDQSDFQQILKSAYAQGNSPHCTCKIDENGYGQACYIAKLSRKDGDRYIIKRLPSSGAQHANTCEHYEIDELLSGRSGLSRDAIVEDLESGITSIKLQVPLSKKLKAPSLNTQLQVSESSTLVQSKQTKLSTLGVFHYLIEAVGLNRWSPKMKGKRYYGLVRYLLHKQATITRTKKESLASRFFMPPPFSKDKIEENNADYYKFLQSLKPLRDTAPIGVFVGKFKEFGSVLNFSTLTVLHMGPKHTLLLEEDVVTKILRKHRTAFELQSVYPELQIFFIATVINFHDRLKVESIDFMLFTPEFLPLEPTDHDWRLHKQLIDEERYFDKPLRFSLPIKKPISSAILLDTMNDSAPLMFDINLPNGEQEQTESEECYEVTVSTEENLIMENADKEHEDSIELPDSMIVISHSDYHWQLPKQKQY